LFWELFSGPFWAGLFPTTALGYLAWWGGTVFSLFLLYSGTGPIPWFGAERRVPQHAGFWYFVLVWIVYALFVWAPVRILYDADTHQRIFFAVTTVIQMMGGRGILAGYVDKGKAAMLAQVVQ
jgi:hypothetical protein